MLSDADKETSGTTILYYIDTFHNFPALAESVLQQPRAPEHQR